MSGEKFIVILPVLATMLLINCVMSDAKTNDGNITNLIDATTEWMSRAFVATTPAINVRLVVQSVFL
jgi:hypothetical protein